MAPPYLLSELCWQTRNLEGRRQLRSATRGDLDVPICRLLHTADRPSALHGPAAWNSLPDRLKNKAAPLNPARGLGKLPQRQLQPKSNLVQTVQLALKSDIWWQ